MSGALIAGTNTLATLTPGESATIESFMFGALGALCGDLGIRAGETVTCRSGTGGMLVLDTQDGHTVSLARDWARFIRLRPVPPPAAPEQAAPPAP